MRSFGLRRSQTQRFTPGDGDCAFHSVLDGYNNLHPEGSLFERKEDNTEDTIFARKMVVHSLKVELQKQYSRGCMDLAYAMSILGSPAVYLEKMKKRGEFADHIVLQMLASILHHDIIIVNVHPDTTTPTLRLPGGEVGSGESAGGQAIYVAFYEEVKFSAGHYQAVEPLPDSNVTAELGILFRFFMAFYILFFQSSVFHQERLHSDQKPTQQLLQALARRGGGVSALMSVLMPKGGISRHPRSLRHPRRSRPQLNPNLEHQWC